MARKDASSHLSPPEITAAFADPATAQKYPPILTTQQAADLIQVPLGTIYDWSSRGLLRGCAKRAGKHLRIFRDRFVGQIFNEGLYGSN